LPDKESSQGSTAAAKIHSSHPDGLTVDELTAQFGRDQFESDPFNLLMFIFGTEIDGGTGNETHC
jgi:hypothetical protein